MLVLGTLPSRKSIEQNQYYGHPQNAFWRIMGVLFGAGLELPYEQRVDILIRNHVAVWDVLAASVRPGSMDADIDRNRSVPNDFESFFDAQPDIEQVFFNGKTAEQLFTKLVAPVVENGSNRRNYQAMPSTSPAHASLNFEQKLELWRAIGIATGNK